MAETINFVNNIAILTIEQLRQTYHENHLDGSPVGGIYHFQLIDDVMDKAKDYNLLPVITEIFAASNRDKYRPGVTTLPQLEKEFGEGSVESHLLRRVYTTIELHKNSTDELVTTLCIAYHQKGIQIGIGPMVRICKNQTILGYQDVVSNYSCWGKEKLKKEQRDIPYLLKQVDEWFSHFDEDSERRIEFIQKCKETQFLHDSFYQLVGRMVEQRVIVDASFNETTIYALNNTQINKSVEIFLQEKESIHNFWDAYNIFNRQLKPASADIPTILPQSLALHDMIAAQIGFSI